MTPRALLTALLILLIGCAYPKYPKEDRLRSPNFSGDANLRGEIADAVREADFLMDTLVSRIGGIEDEVNRLSKQDKIYTKTAGWIALLGVSSAYLNDNLGGKSSVSIRIGIWTTSISGLMLTAKSQIIKSDEYLTLREQRHRSLTRIYDDTIARYGTVYPLLIAENDSLRDKGLDEIRTMNLRLRLALNQNAGK